MRRITTRNKTGFPLNLHNSTCQAIPHEYSTECNKHPFQLQTGKHAVYVQILYFFLSSLEA